MKRLFATLLCTIIIFSCATGCEQDIKESNLIEETRSFWSSNLYNVTPLLDKTIYEDNNYKLERIAGRCYIKIKPQETVAPLASFQSSPINSILDPTLSFDSMDDFVNTVSITGLSADQLHNNVASFGLNGHYESEQEVCDFERMYTPVFPDGIVWQNKVYWLGDYYSFYPTVTNEILTAQNVSVKFIVMTENCYNESLQRRSEEFLEKPIEYEDGTRYVSESSDALCYRFWSDGTSYTVIKYYKYRNSHYPYIIRLYCQNNDVFYSVYINMDMRGDVTDILELLTEDFLSQFKVQKYTPQ